MQGQLEERLVAPFVQRRLSLTIVILETHSYIYFFLYVSTLCVLIYLILLFRLRFFFFLKLSIFILKRNFISLLWKMHTMKFLASNLLEVVSVFLEQSDSKKVPLLVSGCLQSPSVPLPLLSMSKTLAFKMYLLAIT